MSMKIFWWSRALIVFGFVSVHGIHARINQETLDQYLQSKGFTLSPLHSEKNEGYMSEAQKKQFIKRLKSPGYRSITSVLEIGLNAGHSAEMFLQNAKNIHRFLSIDINQHAYTKHAIEYFQKKYPKKFLFLEGDSKRVVPELFRKAPGKTFDLIYIDGDHRYDGCKTDIINCKHCAHNDTLVWIDDCEGNDVERVVKDFVKQGFLKLIKTHTSEDQHGRRVWAEAQFLFKNKQQLSNRVSLNKKVR